MLRKEKRTAQIDNLYSETGRHNPHVRERTFRDEIGELFFIELFLVEQ